MEIIIVKKKFSPFLLLMTLISIKFQVLCFYSPYYGCYSSIFRPLVGNKYGC